MNIRELPLHIKKFRTYMQLEKSMAANTLEAYISDVIKVEKFMEETGKGSSEATHDDIQAFFESLFFLL